MIQEKGKMQKPSVHLITIRLKTGEKIGKYQNIKSPRVEILGNFFSLLL